MEKLEGKKVLLTGGSQAADAVANAIKKSRKEIIVNSKT
jgi:hypothetical protein